jgi:CBS domain-containing protein
MTESETALEGYNRMASKKIHALPIVDNAGLVVATLSASDLRGLSRDTVEKVKLPVTEFLKVTAPLAKKRDGEPVSITPDDTLMDALTLMVEKNVHRVWILNSMLRPVGCISQSDIIGALVGITPGGSQ